MLAAWRRDRLRTLLRDPDAGRAAPARPVAASSSHAHPVPADRKLARPFSSSGRTWLRTFAEASVEHPKHWAVVHRSPPRSRSGFTPTMASLAERLAEPAAPALPHPQGRDAQPRRLRRLPLAGATIPAGVAVKVLAGTLGDEVTRAMRRASTSTAFGGRAQTR